MALDGDPWLTGQGDFGPFTIETVVVQSKRFSNVSAHQNHLEVLVKEMAGLHPGDSDSVSLGGAP